MSKEIEDFGFEFIGNPETLYDESYPKLVECVNLVMPLIDNLLKNGKADVIHWPAINRIDQLTRLKNKLNSLIVVDKIVEKKNG